MDKDKLTDITEDTIENTTETINDPEASALFKELFLEEGKALEEEALAHPYTVDEERKEALRRRILAAAEEEDLITETLDDSTIDNSSKKKKHRFSPLVRWAAVLALVCAGVFGGSMTSQAKGSGLWSSIQRLIGVETRWTQENNGEDRTYTCSDEFKAISEIEEKLNMKLPAFYYWPGEVTFYEYDLLEDANWFVMLYMKNEKDPIYFEGWGAENDTSAGYDWEGKGTISKETFEGITYNITEVENENSEKVYYVSWSANEGKFLLSGETNLEELKKILKNIQY